MFRLSRRCVRKHHNCEDVMRSHFPWGLLTRLDKEWANYGKLLPRLQDNHRRWTSNACTCMRQYCLLIYTLYICFFNIFLKKVSLKQSLFVLLLFNTRIYVTLIITHSHTHACIYNRLIAIVNLQLQLIAIAFFVFNFFEDPFSLSLQNLMSKCKKNLMKKLPFFIYIKKTHSRLCWKCALDDIFFLLQYESILKIPFLSTWCLNDSL